MNLRLLKNKNLTLLILGQFVSQIGSGMQSFAFSLYALRLTGSGSQFASVLALGIIPRIILGPICGVFVDWLDRKKIIVYSDLLCGILIGGLYFISLTTTLTLIHIYITVILLSIISSFFGPAIGTAIPSVVEKEDLVEANSMNSLLNSIGNLLYPILAGMIFGVFGISFILLLNAVSFILSAISEMFITLKGSKKQTRKFSFTGFKEDFKGGITYIFSQKLIRKLLICALIANLVLNPTFSVGFTYVANIVIGVTDVQLGIMNTLMVIGSMMGTMVAGFIAKRLKLTKLFFIALTAVGLLVGLIALNSSPYYLNVFGSNTVPYITFALLGLLVSTVVTVVNIVLFSLIQKETPMDMMGRINSVLGTTVMSAIPIGQIVFGFLFDKVAAFIPLLLSCFIITMTAVIFNFFENKNNSAVESLEISGATIET